MFKVSYFACNIINGLINLYWSDSYFMSTRFLTTRNPIIELSNIKTFSYNNIIHTSHTKPKKCRNWAYDRFENFFYKEQKSINQSWWWLKVGFRFWRCWWFIYINKDTSVLIVQIDLCCIRYKGRPSSL